MKNMPNSIRRRNINPDAVQQFRNLHAKTVAQRKRGGVSPKAANDDDDSSQFSESLASSRAHNTTARTNRVAGTWFNKLDWTDDDRFENFGLNRTRNHEVHLKVNKTEQ